MIEIITVERFKALTDYDIAARVAADRLDRIDVLNNRVSTLGVLYSEMSRKLIVELSYVRDIVAATDNPQASAAIEFGTHYDASKVVYELMQEASKEAGEEMAYLIWFKATVLEPAYKAALKLLEGEKRKAAAAE